VYWTRQAGVLAAQAVPVREEETEACAS